MGADGSLQAQPLGCHYGTEGTFPAMDVNGDGLLELLGTSTERLLVYSGITGSASVCEE